MAARLNFPFKGNNFLENSVWSHFPKQTLREKILRVTKNSILKRKHFLFGGLSLSGVDLCE